MFSRILTGVVLAPSVFALVALGPLAFVALAFAFSVPECIDLGLCRRISASSHAELKFASPLGRQAVNLASL